MEIAAVFFFGSANLWLSFPPGANSVQHSHGSVNCNQGYSTGPNSRPILSRFNDWEHCLQRAQRPTPCQVRPDVTPTETREVRLIWEQRIDGKDLELIRKCFGTRLLEGRCFHLASRFYRNNWKWHLADVCNVFFELEGNLASPFGVGG